MMKKVTIPCQGIDLEGIIGLPHSREPFGLVVVCHPHPLYGGNMYNNVVHTVCEKLEEKGMAWLKFNFRGVGQSTGTFANGIGEREDVKAAVSFAEARPEINEENIGLCGYSFGGLVALSAAVEDGRVKAIAGVSPLIQPEDLLDRYTRPKLLVCGDQDDFIDVHFLERVTARIPEPKELAVFPGVDHFWTTEGEAMAEKVSRFFQKYL